MVVLPLSTYAAPPSSEALFPAITLFVYADLHRGDPDLELRTVIQAGFLLYLLYGFAALPWGLIGHRFDEGKSMGLGMLMAGRATRSPETGGATEAST